MQSIADAADVAVRPLVEPEPWREVSLMTVPGRKHAAAVGALVGAAARWRRAVEGPQEK